MGHPWEQRKLGSITTRILRKNKNLESELPLTISAQDGLVDQETFFNKRVAGKDLEKYLLIRNGEFAYNKSYSAGFPWGAVKRLEKYEKGVVSSLYILFSAVENKVDPIFLETYFETDRWYDEMRIRAAEGARNHGLLNIPASDFFDINIKLPSLDEQVMVGEFFVNLNHLITLHQRKLDLLKEKKKGLLQKMFPKPGENKPELRFSGFTDPWKQRKISELFKITRGNVLAANKTEAFKSNEDPYPVYSSQTKNNGLMGYYKDYLYENAITWTTDGANAGTVNYRSGKFYCTNVCGVLLAKEIQPCLMVAERLNSVTKDYVSYVGNPKLMNNVMADININLPWQEEERQKMSDLFAMVDDLITLHQRKLDLLKEKKKGLLQKMFPKPGQQEPELRFSEFR